jgi:hypothetical protein
MLITTGATCAATARFAAAGASGADACAAGGTVGEGATDAAADAGCVVCTFCPPSLSADEPVDVPADALMGDTVGAAV